MSLGVRQAGVEGRAGNPAFFRRGDQGGPDVFRAIGLVLAPEEPFDDIVVSARSRTPRQEETGGGDVLGRRKEGAQDIARLAGVDVPGLERREDIVGEAGTVGAAHRGEFLDQDGRAGPPHDEVRGNCRRAGGRGVRGSGQEEDGGEGGEGAVHGDIPEPAGNLAVKPCPDPCAGTPGHRIFMLQCNNDLRICASTSISTFTSPLSGLQRVGGGQVETGLQQAQGPRSTQLSGGSDPRRTGNHHC